MRVTGDTITSSLIHQLNLLAARQNGLQTQVSTGLRISAPEDDPAAVGSALNLEAASDRTDQYARNVNVLQNRANAASSALQALKTISDRAGELATQADGTSSPQDLQAAAVELRQLIQQAVQLANTQDGNGYIFAGTAVDQQPFTATTDANGNVTAVTYSGNSGVMSADTAQGSSLSATNPGVNLLSNGPRGVFQDDRYGADFFNHLISLQNHLLAGDTASIASTDRPALVQDEDNLIYQTANTGAVLARLDAVATSAQDQKTSLQQTLAGTVGADPTETIVQLSQTQNAYQLAVQSSAKILQLQQTLLSYLP